MNARALQAAVPTLALAFVAFYLFDVRGTRFEVMALGWVIGAPLAAIAAALLAQALRSRTATPGATPRFPTAAAFGVALGLAAYAWTIPRLGFVASTLLIVVATGWLIGGARWRSIVVLAALLAFGGYVVFIVVLGLRLG